MSITTEGLVELETTLSSISKNVNKYWKTGVTSKLKLATEISKFIDEMKTSRKWAMPATKEMDELNRIENAFLDSLPFGEEVVKKFNRIGKCEWLYKAIIQTLPNCYNSLDKLTTSEIVEDEEVLDFVKNKITADTNRVGIDDLIRKAKGTSLTEDADVDGDADVGGEDGEEEGSNETRTASILNLKINKAFYKSSKDVKMLFIIMKTIEADLKAMGLDRFAEDVFNIEIKNDLIATMMKKARKDEVDKSEVDFEDLAA